MSDTYVDIDPNAEGVSLDEYMVIDGAPERFVENDRTFSVNNDDEALWLMRQLAHRQRRIDEVMRQATIERERIDRWVAANTESNKRNVALFDEMLGAYLLRCRFDESDGRKSMSFPDGKVSSRETPDTIDVEDLDAFVVWAEENGHENWIRVKKEADKKALKDAVDFSESIVLDPITGEIVEGLKRVVGGYSTATKVSD